MTETLTQSQEKISQAEITSCLDRSLERVVDFALDNDFHQQLVNAEVTLGSEDNQAYWEQMALFVSKKASAESASPLEKQSLLLTGFLPNFIYAQHQLATETSKLTDAERKSAKRTACVYNGLIKDFVTHYPQSSLELNHSLVDAGLQTVGTESRELSDSIETTLTATLKGVKHELAFAATLDTFGLPYRSATTQEDLKGKDLILLWDDREIGIDVKASLTSVDQKNNGSNNSPIALKSNGDIVAFSLYTESDFGDSFIPNESALELKAPVIAGYLQVAINQLLAK